MTPEEWSIKRRNSPHALSAEDSEIINLLIAGKSTVEIGKILSQHRSMIWRKIQKIRKHLES